MFHFRFQHFTVIQLYKLISCYVPYEFSEIYIIIRIVNSNRILFIRLRLFDPLTSSSSSSSLWLQRVEWWLKQ